MLTIRHIGCIFPALSPPLPHPRAEHMTMAVTPIHRTSKPFGLALVALALGLLACSKEPQVQVVQGECRPLFGSDACTWGRMSGDSLVSFGATIALASVEGAPAEAAMVWPPVMAGSLDMPTAVQTATGFRTLTMYWEPHGHPPGAFLTPHFDFHFYAIPLDTVKAIDWATRPGRPNSRPDTKCPT